MNIEVGDYFLIARGRRCHVIETGVAALEAALNAELPPYYDRSWQGVVMEAKDVQGDQVCAEIVGCSERTCTRHIPGSRHVFDMGEVLLAPVGRRFAELMRPVPVETAVPLGMMSAVPLPAGGMVVRYDTEVDQNQDVQIRGVPPRSAL